MSATKILWGQILAVFLIVLTTTWGATQWVAWRLGFQAQLGSPWFEAFGMPIYPPPAFFWWWYFYDAYARMVFWEGGAIAGYGRLWDDRRMIFSVHVEVRLREGIADPQGSTVERALPTLGFDGVRDVRVGKSIRFSIDSSDEASARAEAEDMCRRFLTNPVIEDAVVELEAVAGAAS